MLEDIELFIRRNDRPDEESLTDLSDAGVLRLSEFSDGERLVLARWALFHLLAGQDDALLLLDEPETHFNDAWKREIVQVVDQAMGADASQVLIATHSPVFAALPGAALWQLDTAGMHATTWEDLDLVVNERYFLADPQRFLRHLRE